MKPVIQGHCCVEAENKMKPVIQEHCYAEQNRKFVITGGEMKKGKNSRFKEKKKRTKSKKTGIFYLFHPEDLQKQIDSYGYSFSMGKYV